MPRSVPTAIAIARSASTVRNAVRISSDPELPANANSQSFARTLFAKARRENMTLRDLYNIAAAARGHWVIWGTPTRIADTLQEWFEEGLADGFMIQPAYFPGAFDDFVDLVVPELQRRGIFRREYLLA